MRRVVSLFLPHLATERLRRLDRHAARPPGRGAPVTYLSHTASFRSNERIAPSNRGIKHLGSQPNSRVRYRAARHRPTNHG
ncbi:MAG: hypothetical protein EOO77_22195 [Oxalobacteraceae bacterium]|nr:MAG: hypothetical protein EOO77_22195 [Oxalobacteraceae bacterium]